MELPQDPIERAVFREWQKWHAEGRHAKHWITTRHKGSLRYKLCRICGQWSPGWRGKMPDESISWADQHVTRHVEEWQERNPELAAALRLGYREPPAPRKRTGCP